MPWRGFHSYDVAFGKVELIIIEEISFSCILKLHFYEVRHLVVARNVAVIVERIELMLGASTTASRKSSESRVGDGGIVHVYMLESGCAPHEKGEVRRNVRKMRAKLGTQGSTLEAGTSNFAVVWTNLSRQIAIIVAASHAHCLSPATAKVTFFEQSAKEVGGI
jgi:hypothetical protein